MLKPKNHTSFPTGTKHAHLEGERKVRARVRMSDPTSKGISSPQIFSALFSSPQLSTTLLSMYPPPRRDSSCAGEMGLAPGVDSAVRNSTVSALLDGCAPLSSPSAPISASPSPLAVHNLNTNSYLHIHASCTHTHKTRKPTPPPAHTRPHMHARTQTPA
jgi:hypothetical protein